MNVSVRWLQEYVEITNVELEVMSTGIDMRDMKVKDVQHLFERTKKIEVGRIAEITPHPDAENLVVIQVDVGEDAFVQIVTGATNCEIGSYAPIVRKNGRIADGTKIKKGRLRGIESFGMLCSLEELGYDPLLVPTEMYDNIYILEKKSEGYVAGTDITEALPEFRDTVITIETQEEYKGVKDVAEEIAIAFKKGTRHVDDDAECYKMSRVIDVDAVRTPDWLKLRLMKSGIKPKDQLSDVIAYVEYEFGKTIKLYDPETLDQDRLNIESYIELEIRNSGDQGAQIKRIRVNEDQGDPVEYQMLERVEQLLKNL